MNCQLVKPPIKDGQPDTVRCQHCREPKRIAMLSCVHPNAPIDKGVDFRPICGGMVYLFSDVVPAPAWCPLNN